MKLIEGYTNKEGKYVEYKDKEGRKIPRLRIVGKELEDKELIEVECLVDGIRVFQPTKAGQYPSYQLFCRFKNTTNPVNLDLSKQAYESLNSLSPKKYDLVSIKKGSWTNEKTGAVFPIALFEVSQNNPNKAPSKPSESEDMVSVNSFLETYKRFVEKEKADINHFVGTFFRIKTPKDFTVSRLVEAFGKEYPDKIKKEVK